MFGIHGWILVEKIPHCSIKDHQFRCVVFYTYSGMRRMLLFVGHCCRVALSVNRLYRYSLDKVSDFK